MARLLLLSLPSAALLGLLVWHSMRVLPRSRALAFWTAAVVYGVLRGIGVRLVTERVLGGSFPYVIHEPFASFFGVSLQEVCGWAIAAYLAWWLGYQLARSFDGSRAPRLFAQIVWASLFLGTLSWAVEATAVASGWWHWTIPAHGGWLGGVPFIALVDWAFVGIDFLLPFLVLTSPMRRAAPAAWLTVGVFPLHFAAHAFTRAPFPWLPIPIFHLVHWSLGALVLWLALRSRVEDPAFAAEGKARWIPRSALGLLLLDLGFAHLFWLGKPELLLSLVPLAVLLLLAWHPAAWILAAVGAAALSLIRPAGLVAGAVALAPVILRWAARGRGLRAVGVMVALAVLAVTVHSSAARRERRFRAALDAALATRDRGDLHGAVQLLDDVKRDYPASHAAHGFLGEIHYRLNRWPEARAAFEAAVDIKSDFRLGLRYLAVLDLLQRDSAGARERTERARSIAPDDLELHYLWYRARGTVPPEFWNEAADAGPAAIEAVAALAFEVGDARSCSEVLDIGLQRWPQHRALYRQRLNLAMSQEDASSARRTLAEWVRRFPEDEQARKLHRQLVPR